MPDGWLHARLMGMLAATEPGDLTMQRRILLAGAAGLGMRGGVFRAELHVGTGYFVGVDFFGAILERNRAQLFGLDVDRTDDLVQDVLREAYAAGMRQ